MTSRRSWGGLPVQRGCWPAGPAVGSTSGPESLDPSRSDTAQRWKRFSLLRATETSNGSSRSSIPTWWLEPTGWCRESPPPARGPHDVTARALRFAPLGRWTCAGAVGDAPALFVLHEGRLLAALIFGFRDASIVGIDTITDLNELQGLDIATFDD